MKTVFLLNEGYTPHYRAPVYNHLSRVLRANGFALKVVSEGMQPGTSPKIEYEHANIHLSFFNIAKLILTQKPNVLIYWVRFRNLYLFPILFLCKLVRIPIVYWGHGSDLYQRNWIALKKSANNIEFIISNALILYADHLKKYVNPYFHKKSFIANNTLCFSEHVDVGLDKVEQLSKYNIRTRKNIVCMGRMQKRKRLDDLFTAFTSLNRKDVGLIFIGPDTDGILEGIHGENVFKLGSIYGNERLNILSAADVYAFYCGLPIVTESGDESPEIMYLKNGVNGFAVPRGDIRQLAEKLELLLDNSVLRNQFSMAAKTEISTNGHIDTMCNGFVNALSYVFSR